MQVPREDALAFALIYHAIQVVPLIVVGLIFELRLVLGQIEPPDEPSTNTPAP